MSWTITHSVSSTYTGDSQMLTGLTITHNINPVVQGSGTIQIQSDWNQMNLSELDYIKNKPTIPDVSGYVVDANYVHTDNNFSDTAVSLLAQQSGTNTGDQDLSGLVVKGLEAFLFAASDETTVITSGVAKISGHWPYNYIMSSLFIGLNVVSSSGNVIIDFNDKNGNTIFSTRPTILAGERTSLTNPSQPVLITTSFTKGDAWSLDIDLAGASAKGLKFYSIGTKS